MNRRKESAGRALDRAIAEACRNRPSADEIRRAGQRVLDNLEVPAALSASILSNDQPDSNLERRAASQPQTGPWKRRPRWVVPALAGICILFVLGAVAKTTLFRDFSPPTDGITTGSGRDAGKIEEQIRTGSVIRTGATSGQTLSLPDKSRIELSAGAELLMDDAVDGPRINLNAGSVIITAARPQRGHLYVKTEHCVVSVVGTVFAVTAEAAGSRVFVFEGAVRVERGGSSETLAAGQQAFTNSLVRSVPLAEAISWSANAPKYLALIPQPANAESIVRQPNTLTLPATNSRGLTGRWRATGFPDAWLNLGVNGSIVTGSVENPGGRMPIFEGQLLRNTVRFKATNADGDRTVTFIGAINGDEIQFTRSVEVRPGGDPGESGIYGVYGPASFVARRVAGDATGP